MRPRSNHSDVDVREAFGAALRNARRRAGVSQERLAAQCGLDRTTLGKLERGMTQPTLQTILILANHLGIPASALVDQVEKLLGEGEE